MLACVVSLLAYANEAEPRPAPDTTQKMVFSPDVFQTYGQKYLIDRTPMECVDNYEQLFPFYSNTDTLNAHRYNSPFLRHDKGYTVYWWLSDKGWLYVETILPLSEISYTTYPYTYDATSYAYQISELKHSTLVSLMRKHADKDLMQLIDSSDVYYGPLSYCESTPPVETDEYPLNGVTRIYASWVNGEFYVKKLPGEASYSKFPLATFFNSKNKYEKKRIEELIEETALKLTFEKGKLIKMEEVRWP